MISNLRRWIVFDEDLLQRTFLLHLVEVVVEDLYVGRALLEAPTVRLEVVLCRHGYDLAVEVFRIRPVVEKHGVVTSVTEFKIFLPF